jgi:hypothetical protein
MDEQLRLVGLHLGETDSADAEWVYYDIGRIADSALEALKTAVLAMEQIVSGEKLVNSLDVGDFYNYLSAALEQENGQGVMSDSGAMASLQDEIQGLIDIVNKARRIAKHPSHSSRNTSCIECNGSGIVPRRRTVDSKIVAAAQRAAK